MISSFQLKTYLKNVKDLEIICYQLSRLYQNLNEKLKYQTTQERTISVPIKAPTKSSWIFPLLGLFIGGIFGVIIGFLRWLLFSKEGFLYNFIGGGGEEPILPYMKGPILVCGLIGFAFVLVIVIIDCVTFSSTVSDYQKRQLNQQHALSSCRDEMQKISIAIQQCEIKYNETKQALARLYSWNYIYPKYQGLVSVCTIFEYLDSGRCYTLEGHEGAYNLYESELRMNQIIGKLDDIIWRLDDLSLSQQVLGQALRQSNDKIDRLCGSVDSMVQSATLTQYYSSVTASTSSYLAWSKYLG